MTTLTFSGPTLRALRIAAGVKREALALAIERSAYTVQEYECGRVLPPADVLGVMAGVLGVSVGAFYVDSQEVPA